MRTYGAPKVRARVRARSKRCTCSPKGLSMGTLAVRAHRFLDSEDDLYRLPSRLTVHEWDPSLFDGADHIGYLRGVAIDVEDSRVACCRRHGVLVLLCLQRALTDFQAIGTNRL